MNTRLGPWPGFLALCGAALSLPQAVRATTVHQVQPAIHVSVAQGVGSPGIDGTDINTAFWLGTVAVQQDQDAVTSPIADNPCDTRFQGTGSVAQFPMTMTDGTISSSAEEKQLRDNGIAFYIVVDEIHHCKGQGGSFEYCSPEAQKPFWVTNELADTTGMPGVMFAHAFGHSMGLRHSGPPQHLMTGGTLTNRSVAVTASECDSFRTVNSVRCPGPNGICEFFESGTSALLNPLQPMNLLAVPLDISGGPSERLSTAGITTVSTRHGAVTAIEELARGSIADSLPMDAVGKYDGADVAVLRANMGKGSFRTHTALQLMGMLSDGSPEDIGLLGSYLSSGSEHDSGAAGAGLGFLVARLGVRDGIEVLARAAQSSTPRVARAGRLGLSISGQEEAERVLDNLRRAGPGDPDLADLLAFNRRVRADGWYQTYSGREPR
ncbi:MAG: hypothetical protein OXR73_28390 [Myxococcales bacterium]|nr:hypothetical protein [Myxococcales bacterium]